VVRHARCRRARWLSLGRSTGRGLLAALGGIGGVALGIMVTAIYAYTQHWPTVVPPWAMIGGVAATLIIGGIAGLYPAIRAARLAPTEALASP
jgi:putative ABC transport system permease protein